MPSFRLLPALQEQPNFLLSTDQRCQSSCLSHIESARGTTCFEHAVHLERLWHTSEGLYSQVLTLEIALDQAIGRFTDSHRIGRSQSLYPGSNVWRFTQRELFLTPCSTHFTDYDETRIYPKSYSQGDAFGWGERRIQCAYGFHNTQPGTDSSVGIVFMRV